MNLPNKAHFLPHEVKAFLGISRSTLYRYLRTGIIPSVRVKGLPGSPWRGLYRIPREEFLKWYESQPKNGQAA